MTVGYSRIDAPVEVDIYRAVDRARGDRISEAMARRGLLYNCQLCYDLGVAESTLSRWRAGKPITLDHAIALTGALGVSLDFLFLGLVEDEQPLDVTAELREFCDSYLSLDETGRDLCKLLVRSLVTNAARSATLDAFIESTPTPMTASFKRDRVEPRQTMSRPELWACAQPMA